MTTPHQSDVKGVDNGGERQRNSASESHGGRASVTMDSRHSNKLGSISGVYIPVFLNIMSILMFLRFGLIIGKIGFVGILGKLQSRLCKLKNKELILPRIACYCVLH